MQKFVEENVQELFNLQFLATEYTLNEYRFDTIAFDEANNAFVIIEYKRGKNESLVDQGFAYLSTALDRKAELVLLYNKVYQVGRDVKNFDWGATRVFFVSPQFTKYQKSAVGFQQMPFRLFEIKKYLGGLYSVDEIVTEKVQGGLKFGENNPTVQEVLEEVKVFTEEDHIEKLSEAMQEVYRSLRDRILEIGEIEIVPTKCYLAFKNENKNICDLEIYKSHITVFINLPAGALNDPYQKARDISKIGHHGNGDYSVLIKTMDEIDYVLTLIRQSFEFNK